MLQKYKLFTHKQSRLKLNLTLTIDPLHFATSLLHSLI